ncbi:MAG: nucleotidyltransferase [Candidatus Paceibacterota bacterium]
MPIPEEQLKTWSHQGSIKQSADTYKTVRAALENPNAHYHGRDYSIFLQGSYGNDTNIYAESDVDIVILIDGLYFSDIDNLSPEDKEAYKASFITGNYSYETFKQDVINVLVDAFGDDVTVGTKAITVAANGNRRKADVLVAMEFRKYLKFRSFMDTNYVKGICFFTSSGTRIANYPKQHSANLTAKHQNTDGWLKPMVRVIKNLRSRLVDDGVIEAGEAPSYYLEGLLYNVPNHLFYGTFVDCFVNAINWIEGQADKNTLVCANEQYYLLRPNSQTCWEPDDAEKFLKATIDLWKNW